MLTDVQQDAWYLSRGIPDHIREDGHQQPGICGKEMSTMYNTREGTLTLAKRVVSGESVLYIERHRETLLFYKALISEMITPNDVVTYSCHLLPHARPGRDVGQSRALVLTRVHARRDVLVV